MTQTTITDSSSTSPSLTERSPDSVGTIDTAPEPKLVRNLARSVFHLLGRYGAMTLLSGLGTIAITRLLGPSSYGEYAAAVATWAVLGAAADFGFTLMLSRDLPHIDVSHRTILRAAYEVAIGWSSLLALVMVALAFTAGVTSTRGLALLVLAPSMIFNGLNPARILFLVRHRTATLLKLDVLTTFVQVIATVMIAALGLGVVAIAAALSLGSIINSVVIAVAANRFLEPATGEPFARRDLIRRSVPLGMLSIMTKVYLMIDLVLLGWLVTGSKLGDYAAASKLLTVLATIAGVVVAGALPAISSLVGRPHDLEQLVRKVCAWLAVGAMPIFVGVAVFAPVIVGVLLGHKYSGVVPLLRILCVAGVIGVMNNLLGNLMIAFRKTRALFLQTAAAIVVNVAGNIILVPRFGVYASAWLTGACEVLVCLAALASLAREIDLLACVTSTVRPLLAVVAAAAVGLLLAQWTAVAVVASTGCFVALVLVLDAWPAEFRVKALAADLRRVD